MEIQRVLQSIDELVDSWIEAPETNSSAIISSSNQQSYCFLAASVKEI